jgi:hypothetical protein
VLHVQIRPRVYSGIRTLRMGCIATETPPATNVLDELKKTPQAPAAWQRRCCAEVDLTDFDAGQRGIVCGIVIYRHYEHPFQYRIGDMCTNDRTVDDNTIFIFESPRAARPGGLRGARAGV